MKLIIGLGNPGHKYINTRHNAGFRTVGLLHTLNIMNFDGWKAKFNAEISEGRIGNEKVVLMMPQTFMNRSGDAVIQGVNFWKIAPEDVIFALDDIDLPLGTIRIRREGSAGGHKGLQSALERLGTENIPRVRIGIGTPRAEQVPSEDFVLEKFSGEEMAEIERSIQKAADAITAIITEGIEPAMNRYNKGIEG